MLAQLYLHPDEEYTLTDLAERTKSNVKSVHVEANRLVRTGFAVDRRVGQARLVSSPPTSPLVAAMTQLLMLSYGPLSIARDAVADVRGLKRAFIFGSWAARYEGEPGPPPRDVDIAIIGSVSADDADDIAIRVQARTGRSVDVRRIPWDVWTDQGTDNPFVLTLRDAPKVELVEEVDE